MPTKIEAFVDITQPRKAKDIMNYQILFEFEIFKSFIY
jgi:hypothetical protein